MVTPAADDAMTVSYGFGGPRRSEPLSAAIAGAAKPPPYVVVANHPGFARDRIAHWTQPGRFRRHLGRTPAFGDVSDIVVVREVSWADVNYISNRRHRVLEFDDRQPFIALHRSLHPLVVVGAKPALRRRDGHGSTDAEEQVRSISAA